MGRGRTSSAGYDTVPPSDQARLVHKMHVCKSPRVRMCSCKKVHVFKFLWFVRGSYFRVLVMGHENLDLAKISRYMVFVSDAST